METIKGVAVTKLGNFKEIKRKTLKEDLGLSGSEISVNTISAGNSLPFVHSHKLNEEVYIITSGNGLFWLDGTIIPVMQGDILKVDPEVGRSIKASDDEALGYICIQTTRDSIKQVTRQDGVLSEEKPVWV